MKIAETTLSVICPSYNRASLLEDCIVPVMAIADAEFVLVDDGSTDGTLELASTIQERYGKNRFVVIPLEGNEGAQVARNRGMRIARGEFLLFCDSDDVLVALGVKELVETLIQNPDLDYAYGKVVMTDERLKPLVGKEPIGCSFADVPVEFAGYHWHTMGALYRRSYLEKVGLWNIELTGSQDWEYQARVKLTGGRGLFVDTLVGCWRQHEGGRVGTSKFRPDYVRSVVTACDVVLSRALKLGRCDRLLKRRLAKKLIIHALESGANKNQVLRSLCLSLASKTTSNDPIFFILNLILKHTPSCFDYMIYKKLIRN